MQFKALLHTIKHSKVLIRRPHAFFRALISLFKSSVLGRDQLRVVEFIINSECDSMCKMCYATRYVDPENTPLSASEIGDIWRQCEKLGAIVAIVEGGEPTLRHDFDAVINALNPWSNVVVVVSNSLGLNRDKLQHFKKIGISILHLSLDGTTAEENDRIRGVEGHFRKVIETVQTCKEIGLDVYLSSVLSHSGRDRFVRIVKLAEKLDIGVSGALLVVEGRSQDMAERLTEEDRQWLLDFLQKYSHVVRFDWNTNFSGNYECPAGREKISISLYGEVMSCVCNHLSFGDMRKERLQKVWQRMSKFSLFREKNPKCLVGFDTEYRRRYFDSVSERIFLPMSIFSHPTHPALLNDDGNIIECAKD